MGGMRPPLRVRGLTEEERGQILLASDRGEWAPQIAEMLGCNDQTVRDVVKRFGGKGWSRA